MELKKYPMVIVVFTRSERGKNWTKIRVKMGVNMATDEIIAEVDKELRKAKRRMERMDNVLGFFDQARERLRIIQAIQLREERERRRSMPKVSEETPRKPSDAVFPLL